MDEERIFGLPFARWWREVRRHRRVQTRLGDAMPRAPRGRRVPWTSWDEWEEWCRGETQESKHLGTCWRTRGRVPMAVEAREALASADRVEAEGHVFAARLARSAAVVRLVNAVADAQRGMAYQQASVAARAGLAGLPRALVDARHEATHASLPSRLASADASRSARAWIDARYVRAQRDALRQVRQDARVQARTAWTAVSTRSFQRSLSQALTLIPPSWSHWAVELFLVAEGSVSREERGNDPGWDSGPSTSTRRGSVPTRSGSDRFDDEEDDDDDDKERRWRRLVEAMAKRWPMATYWTLVHVVVELADRNEGKASAVDARKVKWLVQRAPLGRRRADALLRRVVQERIQGDRKASKEGAEKERRGSRERERFLEVLQRACESATPTAMTHAVCAIHACESTKDASDKVESARRLREMKQMDPDVQVKPWTRAADWESCAIGTLPDSHPLPRFKYQSMGFKRTTKWNGHAEPGTSDDVEGHELEMEMEEHVESEAVSSEEEEEGRTDPSKHVDVSLVGLL